MKYKLQAGDTTVWQEHAEADQVVLMCTVQGRHRNRCQWSICGDYVTPPVGVNRHCVNIKHSLLQCCDARCVRIAHAHLTPYVMYVDRTRLHGDSISDTVCSLYQCFWVSGKSGPSTIVDPKISRVGVQHSKVLCITLGFLSVSLLWRGRLNSTEPPCFNNIKLYYRTARIV